MGYQEWKMNEDSRKKNKGGMIPLVFDFLSFLISLRHFSKWLAYLSLFCFWTYPLLPKIVNQVCWSILCNFKFNNTKKLIPEASKRKKKLKFKEFSFYFTSQWFKKKFLIEIMLFIRLTAQWLSHFIQVKIQSPNDGLQSPPCAELPDFSDLGSSCPSPLLSST